MACFIGTVKSFKEDRGWGHIECSDTFQTYGKDIFLLRSQLRDANSVSAGAQVSFKITDNGRGPEAVDVTVIDSPAVPSLSSVPDPNKSVGGFSYIGVIKSFNPASGWGHIQCPQTEAIYGKDIFFMKSQLPGGSITKGTQVQFCVGDGLKGPEANNIRPMGGSSDDPFGAGNGLSQLLGGVFPPWGGATMGSPFYGTVKSFNEEKGWGHITCLQTQSIYGKDMFVMRSAINGGTLRIGDTVQFHVTQGIKGPEASNVKVVKQAGADSMYVGIIKQFTEEKGWGFITCEETNVLYGKDIFVHKNNLQGYTPMEGETVQFSVQISPQGRPEAIAAVSCGRVGVDFTAMPDYPGDQDPLEEANMPGYVPGGIYAAVRKSPWGKGRPSPF